MTLSEDHVSPGLAAPQTQDPKDHMSRFRIMCPLARIRVPSSMYEFSGLGLKLGNTCFLKRTISPRTMRPRGTHGPI